jgi:hypothetical protein
VTTEEAARADLERLSGQHPGAEILRIAHVHRGRRYFVKRAGVWRDISFLGRGLSAQEMDAAEATVAASETRGTRIFVGTFTKNHYHPNTGQNLRGARVVFQAASLDDANDLMWDAFGDEGWWDAHDLEDLRERRRADGASNDKFEKEMWGPPSFKVTWPTPPTPVGETVTLRLRVTPAQAAKPDLWLGRRCIMHRPSPDAPVLPGVGVEPETERWPSAWGAGPKMTGIGCEGSFFRVSFFARADAERAVAADPDNVSIVPDSTTMGAFRRPPKRIEDEASPVKPRIVVSGVLTMAMLDALGEEPSFKPVARAVNEAWRALAESDASRAFAVEMVENRLVAIHVQPKGRG